MHIKNPNALSDKDWAQDLQSLHFIRKTEEEASKR
jgi:hypothetical protein